MCQGEVGILSHVIVMTKMISMWQVASKRIYVQYLNPSNTNIWTMLLWTCHAISWVHDGVSHTPLEICRGSDLLLFVSKPAAIPTVPNFCCLESNNNSTTLFTIEDFHTVCMFESKPHMVSFYFDLWSSHYTSMPSKSQL